MSLHFLVSARGAITIEEEPIENWESLFDTENRDDASLSSFKKFKKLKERHDDDLTWNYATKFFSSSLHSFEWIWTLSKAWHTRSISFFVWVRWAHVAVMIIYFLHTRLSRIPLASSRKRFPHSHEELEYWLGLLFLSIDEGRNQLN